MATTAHGGRGGLNGIAGRVGAAVLVLERREYAGPILPDQLWRSRDGGDHGNTELVRVLRFTGGGRVVFMGGAGPGRRGRERRYTLEEPAFRLRYTLHKQVSPSYLRTVAAETVSALVAGSLDEEARAEMLADLERETRGSSVVEGLTPPETLPVAHEAAPPEADGPVLTVEVSEAVDVPEESEPDVDPLEAFLAQGRRTLEALEREEHRVAEDRELARIELQELDERLIQVQAKRLRIARAIEAAIRTLEPEAPGAAAEPEPEPSTEVVPVDPLFERAIIEAPTKRLAPSQARKTARRSAPGREGQQAWLVAQLRPLAPGAIVAIADLVPAYAERFGLTPEEGPASRLSIIMGKLVRDPGLGVAVRHVDRGRYQLGGEPREVPAPEPPPPAEPEPEPLNQRQWVMGKFAEQKLWTVGALVDAWVALRGGEREPARQAISKAISERMKGEIKYGPQLIRVSQGLYEAAG